MALALDREQDGHIRVLQTLALSAHLAEGDLAGFYGQARAVMAHQPGWATVILADLQSGQLLNLRQPFGTQLPKAAFGAKRIARVAATGLPLITPLIGGTVAGGFVTNIGVPVRRNDVVTHVLIAAIDPPAWLAFLRRNPLAADATLTLVDHDGIVIARTLNHERWIGRPAASTLTERLRVVPEAAFRGTGLEGQSFYVAYSPAAASGWTIATGVPSQTVEAALWHSTFAMFGGALVCLGLAAGLAYLFGRRIADSIAALVTSATQLGSARQPTAAAPATQKTSNIEEVNMLARVLDESAARRRVEQLENERTQHALQASEERFRALTAASSDVLYRMSPDWREMRHLDSRDFIPGTSEPTAQWTEKYIPEDDQPRVMAAIDEAIRSKGTFELEHRVLRVDGSPGWTLSRAVPILDANGNISEWFGAASDVTQRKQAEDALRSATVSAERARADAEAANTAKDQFLAVLSHELRTPLAPVLAATDLLERMHDVGSSSRKPLEIIRRNVQLQARLIDDLLDLTRIAQGKLDLKRERIDIGTIIERAVEVARADLDAKNLRFAVALQGAPGQVDADALRLQQVVWNLLSNAIKFTPQGGSVGLHCECLGAQVVIEVTDSGIGIEADATERIFRAFEQGERNITRQFGGLGLGLAIVKRLVEMHGGIISVRSDGRNKGATFRVELPAIAAPSDAVAGPRT